jgi:diguanylate cyclase (GGDEF)-like protein
LPTVLDPSASRSDAPDAPKPTRLFRRLQWHWNELVGERTEDELIRVSTRSTESPGVLVLAFIAALAVVAVIAFIRDGGEGLGMLLGLAGATAALEIVCQILERRRGRILWLLLFKVGFIAFVIGAALWICLTLPDPIVHTRHPIVFLIYLLLISTAGLRDEPRLPVGAGVFSLLSYGTIAALVPRIAEASEPAKAAVLLRDFDGTALIGHSVILFCTMLMAVASARRGQAVRRLSIRDGLTGLVNRRIFDECLASEGERAQRSGLPLSIAMIDIDFFKSLNDTYGHAFGDEVLRWIAKLLRDSFRATDLVARYGGEEFVVVFIDSADDRLVERLDALCARIAATEFQPKEGGEIVRVSVSVGVASWPLDGEQVMGALSVADQRLYLAKGAGRNRVVAGGAASEGEAAMARIGSAPDLCRSSL